MNKRVLLVMIAPLLAAAPFTFAAGHGEAVQAEKWTSKSLRETLAAMPAGDIARGRAAHDSLYCASCHGAQGEAPSRNYPHLAGQRAEYTFKMLRDYRDFRRDEGDGRAQIMVRLTQIMSEQQMADLAAYYASLPLPSGKGNAQAVPKLVSKGDPTRLLTACASCHGVKGQGGKNETPALAGQVKEYLLRTMRTFRQGTRSNDVAAGMSQFAHDLSEEEIQLLADYYASLPKP